MRVNLHVPPVRRFYSRPPINRYSITVSLPALLMALTTPLLHAGPSLSTSYGIPSATLDDAGGRSLYLSHHILTESPP